MPNRAVAGFPDLTDRKADIRCLQLLQANDIRPCFFQPAQEHRQASVDAVDIEGGNLHRERSALLVAFVALTGLYFCFGGFANVLGHRLADVVDSLNWPFSSRRT